MRRTTKLRPEGAPALGETYRDWRDFTDRVARPWLDNDGNDPKADAWFMMLMIERDPWYLACALVMADLRIRALEQRVEAAETVIATVQGRVTWDGPAHQRWTALAGGGEVTDGE